MPVVRWVRTFANLIGRIVRPERYAMRTASTSDKPANKLEVKSAYAVFAKCRERITKFGENVSQRDKANVATDLLKVLPTIREANADDGKKVRRTLRKLGHFISRDGYTAKGNDRKANAKKRERKATTAANVTTNANETPAVDTANV